MAGYKYDGFFRNSTKLVKETEYPKPVGTLKSPLLYRKEIFLKGERACPVKLPYFVKNKNIFCNKTF